MSVDVNKNIENVPDKSPATLCPTLARSPKRVQFPTLQELEKKIPPPGCTPISSSTNITDTANYKRSPPTTTSTNITDAVNCKKSPPTTTSTSITATTNYKKGPPSTASTKLIHSSTSLEVEVDDIDVPSLASICTSATMTDATTISTFITDNQNGECTSATEQRQVYQPPRLPLPRRGSSVPATRTVSTEPAETVSSFNRKSGVSTAGDSGMSRRSSLLPSKSILRKPLLPLKDSNSNVISSRTVDSTGSITSSVAGSYKSSDADNDADGTGAIKNEMWGNTGKAFIPLAAEPSRRTSRRDVEFRTPRSRSTISSSGTFYSQYEVPSVGNKSVSADVLPPMMTESRGGRSVRKQLSNLTSVLAELRQKEVVFDRTTAIQALKARILRGERVTHEEIKAIRNMTLPPHQRHLGYRLPWSTDLYCVKGLVHIPTPNKQPTEKNTFGTMDDLRIPYDEQITMEHYGRRQYVVNLAGFEDDHISLYLEGKNRLVLRAERIDSLDGQGIPMAVTETILLPPDLPADNLRIVRKPSGTTIIEESWRF